MNALYSLATPWMTYSHEQALSAAKVIAVLGARAFRQVSCRRGTKGPYARTSLPFTFALPIVPSSDGLHLPGGEAWLIAENRTDEIRYYLSNRPANASLKSLAASVKARWAREQAHELGLDHFAAVHGTGYTITLYSRWSRLLSFSTSGSAKKS